MWWAARERVISARWAVTTIVMWAAPFLVVPPMGSRDVYSYACQGHLYRNGLDPYQLGFRRFRARGWTPSRRSGDTPAPYGPLFVLITAAAVLLGGSLSVVILLLRLLAVAGLIAVVLGLPVLARRCGVPPRRALWVALAGPLVGVHLIGGPHNDALVIGSVVAGLALLVVGADRPGLQLVAGLILGFAVAVKITAVVVVPFAVLIAVGRHRRRGPVVRSASRVAGAAAATMAAVTAVSGLGLGWIAGMTHIRDLVQSTSPPTAVGMTLTYVGRPVLPDFDAVPAVRVIALLLLAAIVVVSGGAPPRPPTTRRSAPRCMARGSPPQAAMVALAPSFHPWYAAFPLVLLAATTARTDLVMAAATAAAFLVPPDGNGLARFVKFPGAPLMTILVIAVVAYRLRLASRRRRPAEPRLPHAANALTQFHPTGK